MLKGISGEESGSRLDIVSITAASKLEIERLLDMTSN